MFKITLCLALLIAFAIATPFQQRTKRQSFGAGVGQNGFQAGYNSYNPYNPYNQYQYQPYNRFNPYQNQYQFGNPGQIGLGGQFQN
ncbi:hypothetical protein HHI36_000971 [Cryptolaemus montrouzieri]|uniref:Uncharacterized protein n=1 Tax=Cryptolaemus montrouzieri TaxID=559131 RepID=A0ABD2P6J3_9CUCU